MDIWTIIATIFTFVGAVTTLVSLDCKDKEKYYNLGVISNCCILISVFCILAGGYSLITEIGWPDKGLYSNY